MSILWLDLETTGLIAHECSILEVAAILTDDRAEREYFRVHRVCSDAQKLRFADLRPAVQKMHLENGLWLESLQVDRAQTAALVLSHVAQEVEHYMSVECAGVDREIIARVRTGRWDSLLPEQRQAFAKAKPNMAGSTVGFDFQFVRQHCPELDRVVSHRVLDVSSLDEFARRAHAPAHDARPDKPGPDRPPIPHRAMPDIETSMRWYRHYVASMGVP